MKKQSWPAEKIERRAIGDLLAYPQNPMIHSEEQVQKIANSITEYGWTMPALIDEAGVLICGHARVRAAQLLGLSHVPVMVARGWTEHQKKSYRIADNQLPRLSDFNTELLRIELTDLKMAEYPLDLTGFPEASLVQFMANPNPTAPAEFGAVDEGISTEHSCPRCGYRWSGKTDAAGPAKVVAMDPKQKRKK